MSASAHAPGHGATAPPQAEGGVSGSSRGAAASRREGISALTLNRVSVYLRSLRELEGRGVRSVSSQQLADHFHLSSSQIRKDLAQFGEFGVRGVGYEVSALADKLSALLGLNRLRRLIIVGMGNLGSALARHPAFNRENFLVVAGFDADPEKVGRRIGNVPVLAMEALGSQVAELGAAIAILAVPAEAASAVLAAVVEAGVPAVLNFAPASLPSSARCRVKNVDLRIHLEELSFFLSDSASSP